MIFCLFEIKFILINKLSILMMSYITLFKITNKLEQWFWVDIVMNIDIHLIDI